MIFNMIGYDIGITPTGNKDITDMTQVDVTSYATAQIVDENIVSENIKKDIEILGIIGSYEGEAYTESGITRTVDSSGQISILLPSAPKVVIAVYDSETLSPTGKFAFYLNDGENVIAKYIQSNSGGTLKWWDATNAWDSSTNTMKLQVKLEASTTTPVAYIAIG